MCPTLCHTGEKLFVITRDIYNKLYTMYVSLITNTQGEGLSSVILILLPKLIGISYKMSTICFEMIIF